MRNARNAKVMNIDGQFVGVDLGADYCTEHELGIKGIRREFKLNDDLVGIDKRMITKIPDTLFYEKIVYEGMKCSVLVLYPNYYGNNFKIDESALRGWELYSYTLKNDGIVTAWDERSFAILVTERYEKELKELYDAFINLDVAVGVAPSEVFKNGGLKFCIKSKMPQDTIQSIKEADLDYITLQKAVEKTKIKEILKKAGKEYFALSPRWKDGNKKEIIFWLNPYHQDKDNYGWFTVADLKDWANNKGKIPMNNR